MDSSQELLAFSMNLYITNSYKTFKGYKLILASKFCFGLGKERPCPVLGKTAPPCLYICLFLISQQSTLDCVPFPDC